MKYGHPSLQKLSNQLNKGTTAAFINKLCSESSEPVGAQKIWGGQPRHTHDQQFGWQDPRLFAAVLWIEESWRHLSLQQLLGKHKNTTKLFKLTETMTHNWQILIDGFDPNKTMNN